MTVDAYDTREKREATYSQCVNSLIELALHAERHEKLAPSCKAGPICIGGPVMDMLRQAFEGSSDTAVVYVSVAVQELRKTRAQIDDLEKRLDIQRGISQSLTREVDKLDEENQRLLGRIDELENGVRRDDA